MQREKKDVLKHHRNEFPHAMALLLSCFWFSVGFFLTALFFTSFVLIYFEHVHKDKVYDGVSIDTVNVGGKTKEEVIMLFDNKNTATEKILFTFSHQDNTSTISASQLQVGYNSKLLAEQAYILARSENVFTNLYLVVYASFNGLTIPPSYTFSRTTLEETIKPIQDKIYKEPVDALFMVDSGRVTAFQQSSNGQSIDFEKLNKKVEEKIPQIIEGKKDAVQIEIPVMVLKPNVTTQQANSLGIVEVIGEGISYYKGSIQNRIYNIALASSKINGVLLAPGETFSFNQALGDVSKFTGYKEAYIIKDGKTILGDGGGVCQVSTTLFRALLHAGLPITERYPHSYRVYYYEQNSSPGLDATVYAPSVDLKFKNDTNNYILIQAALDSKNYRLTFLLYGKKDGRNVQLTEPVVKNQIQPAPPLYQEDPNFPKGVEKQIEHQAWGATVSFTRTITKNGELLAFDTFSSRYLPWQAVYLRGTKE